MAPWLKSRLSAMARCGSLFSSRGRNNSRILRIDSLSAGILFPAVRQRVQAYLRLRTVGVADRYTVTQLRSRAPDSMITTD
jgi:hypothetical protein